MPDSIDRLLTLARQEFGQLTSADKKLFYAVARHEEANFKANTDELNQLVSEDQWGFDRTLNANRIIWLVTTPETVQLFSFRGLRISGAKIEGKLDLKYATVSIPLIFDTCVFIEPLILQNSKLKTLQLKGTQVLEIKANYMHVEGSVYLHDGFLAKGCISLKGTKIEGSLDCTDGHFVNPKQVALNADVATIAASVYLRNGFEARGQVRLLGAKISKQLYCSGGKFRNVGHTALDANGITVSGSVLLNDDFQAQGEVNLCGALVGGQLNCSSGTFRNTNRTSLNLNGSTIADSVLLNDGFEAQGEVDLGGARISKKLECSGGKFRNAGGTALDANRAEIASSVYLCTGFEADFEAEGEVSLTGASIGGQLVCVGGKFRNVVGKTALCADAVMVAADVFLHNGFEAQGEVRLLRASIGGQLACDGGQFYNPGWSALNVDAATIAADVFLRRGFEAQGVVNLRGATIGGQLSCIGGKFCNAGQSVLITDAATVASGVFLRCGFEAQGEVSLRGTQIGRDLLCTGGRFLNKDGNALNVEAAIINGSVFLGGQCDTTPFQAEGKINFLSAIINTRLELLGMRAWNPEFMALDLRFAQVNTLSFIDAEKTWIEEMQPGQLRLNGLVYRSINFTNEAIKLQYSLKWLRLQFKQDKTQKSPENFALQPYDQLASVLRANGHQKAATQILIAKEDDRRKYGGLTRWDKFWNWFLGITIAHGYHAEKALLYSLCLILLGWVFFGVGEDLMTGTGGNQTFFAFDPLIYSIDTFIPVIDFRQQSTWLPDPNKGNEIFLLMFKVRTGELLRCYFWFQIAAGWALTSLWVAGFTGLVRSRK
jgi:sRNA-binding regulator protein Hfq